jgi:hypothetical protein
LGWLCRIPANQSNEQENKSHETLPPPHLPNHFPSHEKASSKKKDQKPRTPIGYIKTAGKTIFGIW